MISDATIFGELELEILKDADYFCSIEFQENIGNSSHWEKEYKFEMIFFLIHVFSTSKKTKYLSMADHLVEQAYTEYLLSRNNMSFINGGSGVLYAYVCLYNLTTENKYLEKSLKIIETCSDYFLESDQVDESLFLGRSGLLLNVFYVFHLSKNNKLLNLINRLSCKIISNAVQIGRGLAWYNPFELVIQPLCSYGYGASGIGYVFDILGHYFNHEPYKEIARKSFFYVNEQCFDKNSNFWKDYRKNIVNEKDLSEHTDKFIKDDNSFFKKHNIDHSIDHGSAGIVYSQLNNIAVQDKVSTLNKSHLFSDEDLISLAHINLELFNKRQDDKYFIKAKSLVSDLNYQKKERCYLYLAILKLSLFKGKSCVFKFSGFEFKPEKDNILSNTQFLSDANIYDLLNKKMFKKTIECFKTFDLFNSESEGKKAWEHSEEFFENKIKSINVESKISKVIKEVFEYEKDLNDLKLEQRFNPYWHIKELTVLNDRINSLQIPEQQLELKNIIISETVILRKTHHQLSKIIVASEKDIDGILMFWKYDLEKGVVEINLEPIKFLLDLFKKPKCIKVALKEILYYCELLNDEEIIPLVEYSNSINRKDLIRRLPFVFSYQVKILISDGVLRFV